MKQFSIRIKMQLGKRIGKKRCKV